MAISSCYRVSDPEELTAGMAPYAAGLDGFDAVDLATNPDNVVITNGHESFAILEKTDIAGVYAAHHFHPSGVRGIEARTISRMFLRHLFEEYPVVVALRGYTETVRLDARWMARQLGFEEFGQIPLRGKSFVVYVLTRQQFEGCGA